MKSCTSGDCGPSCALSSDLPQVTHPAAPQQPERRPTKLAFQPSRPPSLQESPGARRKAGANVRHGHDGAFPGRGAGAAEGEEASEGPEEPRAGGDTLTGF